MGGGRWEMVEAEGCCCHHVFSLYVCALFAACIPLESRSARGVRLRNDFTNTTTLCFFVSLRSGGDSLLGDRAAQLGLIVAWYAGNTMVSVLGLGWGDGSIKTLLK